MQRGGGGVGGTGLKVHAQRQALHEQRALVHVRACHVRAIWAQVRAVWAGRGPCLVARGVRGVPPGD